MFELVVAVGPKNIISVDGKLPWNLPVDLRFFKQLTSGQVVIMGRKTYESIGKPLPNRNNIIIGKKISLSDQFKINVNCFSDILEAVEYLQTNTDLKAKRWFVIGGAEIYEWFISKNLITAIYYTTIPDDVFDHSAIKEKSDIKYFNYNPNQHSPITHTYTEILQYSFISEDTMESKLINDQTILNMINKLPPNTSESSIHQELQQYQKTAFVTLYKNPFNIQEYFLLSTIPRILDTPLRPERTGAGCHSIFGQHFNFNLKGGIFPLMTTRQMSFKSIVKELLFFVSGQTDTKILEAQGLNIWKHNTSRQFLDSKGLQHYKEGDMGHSYGFSFRHFGANYVDASTDYKGQGFDQINYVINEIKTNPTSRRLLISLWEPNNMHKAPLPPCLYGYQFFINLAEKTISCAMSQRSSDVAVAAGWNIATGALLTYMIGHVTGYEPQNLLWNVGDMHVYANHIEDIKKQIARHPRPFPLLRIKNKRQTIEEFMPGDFVLLAYNPHEKIDFQLN